MNKDFRLYHAKPAFSREAYFLSVEETSTAWAADCGDNWDFVGYVAARDLDEAYERTNSIRNLWTENFHPASLAEKFRKGARSTSIGDVLVDDRDVAHVVASFGFEVLGA